MMITGLVGKVENINEESPDTNLLQDVCVPCD